MKTRLSTVQIQKQILAPSMQQSIEVLLLPLTELDLAIEQELQNNPLLEIDEEAAKKENQINDLVDFHMKRLKETPQEREDHEYTPDEDSEEKSEKHLTHSISLEDHLLQQLRFEFTTPKELKIGEYIIGNLDPDGYLRFNLEDIAQALSINDIDIIEQILIRIQKFDPIGIASRNLKECLLNQAEHKFTKNLKYITVMIEHHLDELGRKNYLDISRKIKVSVDQIKKMIKEIASLEPIPARKYRPLPSNLYVKPDIYVSKDNDGNYQTIINKDQLPPLRLNAKYQNMLKQPNRTKEEIEFIREKIKGALLFIKSIEQRHQTVKNIAEYIIKTQKEFFDEGHARLKPMILKDVAEAIERNESTISRAIHLKYMDTPQGILPMKFFFSQGLSNDQHGETSSRSIKEEIKILIQEENKEHPLSDQAIQLYFENKGTRVARRTINKYRKMLNILPSSMRKS